MNAKRLAVGTLVGGITLFAVGYLIFNLAFANYYAANAGSAMGVDRTEQILWAVIVGSLAYAALITIVIDRRPGSVSIGGGFALGAVVGFLLWATADFIFYGITNVSNLNRTIVDPLLELVHGGVAGAVIGLVLGKLRPSGG